MSAIGANLRGKFIVFDGTEGSGKSTQARLLRDAILKEGTVEVALVRDPGTTRLGERIRQIVLDPENAEMAMRCEMLLYMAARAQMMAETIAPALQSGNLVICDRFVSSTLAYQLGGDGLTADEIRRVAQVATRGIAPDLTLLLDLPAQQSLARVGREKDRIEQRPMEYHEQVRKNYLAQAAADPAHFRVIDAMREPEAIHADALKALTEIAR